jgi:hypothetical protein
MTITARVHNHSIALPADLPVAEGAEVQVTVPDRKTASGAEMESFKAWLASVTGIAKGKLTTDERMQETRGEG